jgi:hypothetical protein
VPIFLFQSNQEVVMGQITRGMRRVRNVDKNLARSPQGLALIAWCETTKSMYRQEPYREKSKNLPMHRTQIANTNEVKVKRAPEWIKRAILVQRLSDQNLSGARV